MKRFVAPLILLFSFLTLSDVSARNACADNRVRQRYLSTAKTAIDPLLELYDVKYVKIDLAMTNQGTAISDNSVTQASVAAASGMSRYAFELSDKLTIDSVKFNGVLSSYTTVSTDLKLVTPPAPLSFGTAFSVQVFYRGALLNGTGFFTHALVNATIASGTKVTYTLSDPYLAKEWWPCKQSLVDKIDSADLWFTVPGGTMAGSNGRLMTVTPVGSRNRYEWKTRYPIEYYLISASVAPYVERNQMVYFSGSADSMPVQHFIYDTATFLPQYGPALDSTLQMVDHFSKLFTRYPFWREKYGHCITNLSGGMEHQTMTTLGNNYSTTLIAHELGHQWWGDHVTYTSWCDIWLSEGFASYCEQLYLERFRNAASLQPYRTGVFNRVMGGAAGSVYVDDTTNVYRIFDSRLTYDKGAAVAHMLRFIAPSDSLYFAGLRAFQLRYAFRTATTDSFRAVMSGVYGRPLDTFFNQWVYGQGFPTYSATWNQIGSDVFVQLNQSTSAPSFVSAFAMPLVLQLKSAGGDTSVKVFLNSGQQFYAFKWSQTMNGLMIDPQDDVVNRAGPVSNDPTLSIADSWKSELKISPNPTTESWMVQGLPVGSAVRFSDMSGRLVWEQRNAPQSLSLSSRHLPAGTYTLQVWANGKAATYKLQRR